MPSPQAPPAKNRECGCPSWVVACVHFAGKVLHVVDLEKHLELCEKRSSSHGQAWSVSVGPVTTPGHVQGGVNPFRTDDLASAQAEFDRRAAELRASG